MSVVDGSLDLPLKLEEEAAAPLAGGIMMYGYQCGMLWGAALAAGAQVYRRLGPGPQAETEAILVTQRLVESFRAHAHNEINCLEISNLKLKNLNLMGKTEVMSALKFVLKGGPIYCFRMAARYAQAAFNEINTGRSDEYIEAPSSPVSCSTMLAQKMGVSEMHTVMPAGFAGGIGLSGGACGALGAAIWILGMNSIKEGVENIGFTPSGAEDALERFVISADYEFECAKIVGRRFENVADHAAYLHAGGCSKIIEALAAK